MSRVLLCVAIALSAAAGFAQDPLKLPGKNYMVAFENSEVAVIRAHYGPHEKIPVHDHTSFSTVFVYLSDSGPVRINHEEAGSTEAPVIRLPTVKGAYRVSPGIAERHSIENLGDLSSDFLRVELKQVSLNMKETFRGKAPQSLGASEDVVEFPVPAKPNPQVQIERIVCAGGNPCLVKASAAPSLLVAFTGFTTDSHDTRQKEMAAGSVHWLPAEQEMSVSATGEEAAHLLRILLPAAQSR